MRKSLYLVFLAGLLSLTSFQTGCTPFVAGLVPNESGFEGAATVAKEEGEGRYGIVTATLPYRDIHGEEKLGQARMVLYKETFEQGGPWPALCHVHYEMSVSTAKKWAKRGWVVFTAAYTENEGAHPIDASVANGNNQARAIIEWVRRLPFIDRTRLHIDGGSQGGYMALAMSAEMFPVTSTTSDCPVVNWAYNINFFEANKPVTGYPECGDSSIPVTCGVTMLTDWCKSYFGDDLSSDAYYYGSPIAWLDRIANPVLLTCATGDMLVPMEQMSRNAFIPEDPALFPEGFTRDFDTLTLCEKARVTFEELVPEEARFTHRIPLQENAYEVTCAMVRKTEARPKQGPKNEDKPWSKDHQWSLLYLDEGPPLPCAGHTSHHWALSPDSFTAHYQKAAPGPEILHAKKLDRLMQRYLGALEDLPLLKEGVAVNRLNAPAVEQRDVVQGLLDYAAMGAAHRERLEALYAAGAKQPWGATLDLEQLKTLLTTLKEPGSST